MRIVNDFPPNISQIKQAFDIEGKNSIVFTYGDILYVPSGHKTLPQHLMVHEETHSKQQREYGSIDSWWGNYIRDPNFRLLQELEAYRNQYKHICETEVRQQRRSLLTILARDLSGPIYGYVITFEKAKELIQNNG